MAATRYPPPLFLSFKQRHHTLRPQMHRILLGCSYPQMTPVGLYPKAISIWYLKDHLDKHKKLFVSSHGEGLGKEQNGIKEALKPKLKHDTNGVGYSYKEFPWWENVYNKTAKTVMVKSDDDGTKFTKIHTHDVCTDEIKTGSSRLLGYSSFYKGGTLENGITVTTQESAIEEPKDEIETRTLSDEELFKICGGRTAQKGARHGLTLSGKLFRIEKLDKKLLKRLKKKKKP